MFALPFYTSNDGVVFIIFPQVFQKIRKTLQEVSTLVFLARPHPHQPTPTNHHVSDTEVWMQYRLGLAHGYHVCHAARIEMILNGLNTRIIYLPIDLFSYLPIYVEGWER